MLDVGQLPAGHQHQRSCSGCYREQCNQASGLSPTGAGRSSNFGDQPSKGVSPFVHRCLLQGDADGLVPPYLVRVSRVTEVVGTRRQAGNTPG